ncbi:hypothetical protein EDB89DRAFT_955119 [Lactarius sanguifluus]|nr:hypothetical protein EDB89DRAFT_955119 [Lactarius sanguifluus]
MTATPPHIQCSLSPPILSGEVHHRTIHCVPALAQPRKLVVVDDDHCGRAALPQHMVHVARSWKPKRRHVFLRARPQTRSGTCGLFEHPLLAALGADSDSVRRADARTRGCAPLTGTILLDRVAIHVLLGGESLCARRQAGRSGRGRGEVVKSREAAGASHVGGADAGGPALSGSEVAGSRHRMHRQSAYECLRSGEEARS